MTAEPHDPDASTERAGSSPVKRQQIIDGANRVFARHGFEGASMSQIAREAGVSKGTLYNYFESKAVLFIATIELVSCSRLSALYDAIVANTHDPRGALTRFARSYVGVTMTDVTMALHRIVVAEGAMFPQLAETFWTNGPEKAISHLATWLELKTEQGFFTIDDPKLAAEQFIALCQTRIITRRRFNLPVDETPADIDRIANAAVSVFFKSYGRESDVGHQ
ncbi:TetR family transcriptional regulator [Ameyamaea chiangmaiensis NBRC 103196]|uniref:TetR/AcrR family transcriptional regulator n=1 Tax=Ameyamaea chiangmaiensis TaxID=442969 RepID=A0A850PI50_9PROT|nr:TetR/AcrR family transcriptional regulator [Ameyamaea chiangmaiensis]MBS4074669.1 TetR/AcrR family transcriptional regulator [Ameyamaea chiangmaiensis]NVN40891.1 TetR/AcrR family transcriptional regulator [Ameyamaea chiangmaiensis]GBQ62303.1 TetR family transcriptional regulator [Ameyamaea chiangmaiensis NBRC 103196]